MAKVRKDPDALKLRTFVRIYQEKGKHPRTMALDLLENYTSSVFFFLHLLSLIEIYLEIKMLQ